MEIIVDYRVVGFVFQEVFHFYKVKLFPLYSVVSLFVNIE